MSKDVKALWLVNILPIRFTLAVSNFSKPLISVNFGAASLLGLSSSLDASTWANMYDISVTLEVSKLDTSNEVKLESLVNIPIMSVTREVSNFDRSNEVNLGSLANICFMLVTSFVSRFFNPSIFFKFGKLANNELASPLKLKGPSILMVSISSVLTSSIFQAIWAGLIGGCS